MDPKFVILCNYTNTNNTPGILKFWTIIMLMGLLSRKNLIFDRLILFGTIIMLYPSFKFTLYTSLAHTDIVFLSIISLFSSVCGLGSGVPGGCQMGEA